MKIYGSSRLGDNEQILDRFIGKDAWIAVNVVIYNQETIYGWIKVLRRIRRNNAEGYAVRWVDSCCVDVDDICRCTSEEYEDFMDYESFINPKYLTILKPLDVVSSEEFFEIEV